MLKTIINLKRKKEMNDINEKELKLDIEHKIIEFIRYHFTNVSAKTS